MRSVKITKAELMKLMADSQNPHLNELIDILPGLSFRITKDKDEFNKKGDILEVQHSEDNKVDFNTPFRCTTTNPKVDGDDIWQLDWFMEGLGSGNLEALDAKAEELLTLWEEAEQFEEDADDEEEEEIAALAATGPSDTQKEVMEEVGMDTSNLKIIEGKSINHYGQAYTDGQYIAFVGMKSKACEKFLYYMGAENEAEVAAVWQGVSVYEGVSESRLERYTDEESEEDAE